MKELAHTCLSGSPRHLFQLRGMRTILPIEKYFDLTKSKFIDFISCKNTFSLFFAPVTFRTKFQVKSVSTSTFNLYFVNGSINITLSTCVLKISTIGKTESVCKFT